MERPSRPGWGTLMRLDQQLISGMIAPGTRVLDIGSGDGA